MFRQRSNKDILTINSGITTTLPVVVMLLLLLSCTGGKKKLAEAILERDSLPMMSTFGVTTLVSDSGVTRYKVDTEEWLMFDRKKPSYWAFEKGIYLEKFDSIFQVEASIKADTAYFYDKDKLWKLIGDVEVENLQGEKFNTEILYWDQTAGRVYSDKFIRIEQIDRIIMGQGFESNQEMTNYKIHNMEGIFYVDESSTAAAPPSTEPIHSDSISTDSINR